MIIDKENNRIIVSFDDFKPRDLSEEEYEECLKIGLAADELLESLKYAFDYNGIRSNQNK